LTMWFPLLNRREFSSDEIRTIHLATSGWGRIDVLPLVEQIETEVREATHGSIRGLVVSEERGKIRISGQAPTQYARQLALCGALQYLSGEQLRAEITVA
jgi:hypothetical protein